MNMKKTKTMWFVNSYHTNDADTNYSISINGVSLSRVYNHLYLGVDLDYGLSFDKHLDSVVNKTTQKLYIFRKIRRFICHSTAVIIYKQMLLLLLEYCNILYNSGKKSKLGKIDKIQTKCIRIIENCHNLLDPEKESIMCTRYNLDSLQNRRDIQLACTMYRLSKREMYVDHNVCRENSRSENKIKFVCPFTRVSKNKNSPFYRGVDLWNTLTVEQHRAESKKKFKNLVKIQP